MPLAERLDGFHSAGVIVIAEGLDADDRAELAKDLSERLRDAKLVSTVLEPGSVGELVVRVTLLQAKEDGSVELSFAVELFDDRQKRLIARFDVTADSKSGGMSGGGGININFESKTSRALGKAAEAIVDHLRELAQARSG